MSYLVVGKRDGERWQLDVKDIGTTSADDLAGIEPAVRELLREHGVADRATSTCSCSCPTSRSTSPSARYRAAHRGIDPS